LRQPFWFDASLRHGQPRQEKEGKDVRMDEDSIRSALAELVHELDAGDVGRARKKIALLEIELISRLEADQLEAAHRPKGHGPARTRKVMALLKSVTEALRCSDPERARLAAMLAVSAWAQPRARGE
jgi:hypothetical protein